MLLSANEKRLNNLLENSGTLGPIWCCVKKVIERVLETDLAGLENYWPQQYEMHSWQQTHTPT